MNTLALTRTLLLAAATVLGACSLPQAARTPPTT